eukprot:SAG11_NODE_278_length_11284_cov_202.732231_18_plen_59_part_00
MAYAIMHASCSRTWYLGTTWYDQVRVGAADSDTTDSRVGETCQDYIYGCIACKLEIRM